MKKILQSIIIGWLIAFITVSPSFAVTYYYKSAGVNTNWSNAANWCDATNGGGTCGASAPTASINAVLDSNSGDVNIDTTACAAQTLVATGYTGVLTFTATKILAVSGNVTFDAGMTLTGTGQLRLSAAGTIKSAGLKFPGTLYLNTSNAITLDGDLSTVNIRGSNISAVFTGPYDIKCDNLYLIYGLTLVHGQTLTVTTSMTVNETASIGEIKSDTASSSAYLVYEGTTTDCVIAGARFTDIDASDSAQALDNWYGKALLRTANIYNVTSASIPVVADVKSGVEYGGVDDTSANKRTGTYDGGGGSTPYTY